MARRGNVLSIDALTRIYLRMQEKGWNQTQLAQEAQLSVSKLSKGFARQQGFTIEAIERLAAVLDMDVSDLLFGPDPSGGVFRGGGVTRDGPRGYAAELLASRPAVLLPIYRVGVPGDPLQPKAPPFPNRFEFAPFDRVDQVGPRGFGLEAVDNAWSSAGIEWGDVAWVNPDRPSFDGWMVAIVLPAWHAQRGLAFGMKGVTDEGHEFLGLILRDTDGGYAKTSLWLDEAQYLGPLVWVTSGREPQVIGRDVTWPEFEDQRVGNDAGAEDEDEDPVSE